VNLQAIIITFDIKIDISLNFTLYYKNTTQRSQLALTA